MSGLAHCTKCLEGKELMITYKIALPTFRCVPICLVDQEYLDNNDVCQKCNVGSAGKPGCRTCKFEDDKFTCLSCEQGYIQLGDPLSCKKQDQPLKLEKTNFDTMSTTIKLAFTSNISIKDKSKIVVIFSDTSIPQPVTMKITSIRAL